MEEKSINSYKGILKSTSIFGSVQVIQIILGIIKSKVLAVFLGPLGLGISSLLQTSTSVIGALTNFGLSTSGIQFISVAYTSDNKNTLKRAVSVLMKLILFSGLLGLIITLFFSKTLSWLTFGNFDYTSAFAILSITMLINQLTNGYIIILQGTRQISLMAKSTVISTFFSLLFTIPFYYYGGKNGIVPAIIISSIISLAVAFYFSKFLSLSYLRISVKEMILESKPMIKVGMLISINGLLVLVFSFILRIFISKFGSVEQVGLYNAGFSVLNTYVGLVFTSMSVDYFPRIAAVFSDIVTRNEVVNQQAEIAVLILSPILVLFLLFNKIIIILLYSKDFLVIENMMLVAAAGIIFKAVSWSIAFLLLVDNNKKIFIINEFFSNIFSLFLNLIGYYYCGLVGLGISFFISYLFYALQVYYLAKKKFSFILDREVLRVLVINSIIILVTMIVVLFLPKFISYFIGIPLFFFSFYYNFKLLDSRVKIKILFQRFRNS